MIKILVILMGILLIVVLFVSPIRDQANHLLQGDRAGLKEEKILGRFHGFSPRVKEIQNVLKGSGFYTGALDGMMGDQTRQAIRAFQKDKGLKPTGKIDQETYLALNRIEENRPQGAKVMTEKKNAAKSQKVDNRHMAQTDVKKNAIEDAIMGHRLQSKDRMKQIQLALNKAGFYQGKIDGRPGPLTRSAIKAFQKSKGLTIDGIVGDKTWQELNTYLKD